MKKIRRLQAASVYLLQAAITCREVLALGWSDFKLFYSKEPACMPLNAVKRRGHTAGLFR
jgi:hypothetical protein